MEVKFFLLGLLVGMAMMYVIARGAFKLALHKMKVSLCLGTLKVVDDPDYYTDGRKMLVRWCHPTRPAVGNESGYCSYETVFRLEEKGR